MGLNPFDLHALSTPPAFTLSQDQTLKKDEIFFPEVLSTSEKKASIALSNFIALKKLVNGTRENIVFSCHLDFLFVQDVLTCTIFFFQGSPSVDPLPEGKGSNENRPFWQSKVV